MQPISSRWIVVSGYTRARSDTVDGDFQVVLKQFRLLIERQTYNTRPQSVELSPIIPITILEESGYLEKFPHLTGVVSPFLDNETKRKSLAVTPSACYPLYPYAAEHIQNQLPREYSVCSYCFRSESAPSDLRWNVFRMVEHVSFGSSEYLSAWRAWWASRSVSLFKGLGMDVRIQAASDPFFGRKGRLLAIDQRARGVKEEIVVDRESGGPCALGSINNHSSYFVDVFGIGNKGDARIESSCVAFGLDRVARMLIEKHGPVLAWPSEVADRLSLR